MAVAPVVEYYRLVDDGTGMGVLDYLKDSNNNVVPASFLDFGTVDAGSDTYEASVSNITDQNSACQVYAIYNNNSNSSGYVSGGVSDMQNTMLSVVSNETGQQGSSIGDVFERKWIQVVLNDHDESLDKVALGQYSSAVAAEIPGIVADAQETKLQLTALGLNEATQSGTIKGAANTGTITAADAENFARIKVWLKIEANAPAGPHLFRLRTTYSYT